MTEIEVRKILEDDIQQNNNLYCLGRYLSWDICSETACLDANFTADELEAIAWWMRNHKIKD